MTALSTRDALAKAIRAVTDLWDEPLDEVHDVPQIVNGLLASGAVVDVATLADDLQFVNTVAQGMTLQAFEDMALSDVLDARRTAGTALRALAAALTERAS